jgi:glycosyltransferase involved in cell wall biosynthesis
MKKVCHFSSVHPGLDIRIYRKQCVSLAQAGFDVHLVIAASAAQIAEAAGAGVTLHALAPLGGGRLRRMVAQGYRCYRAARALNADVYHFHDPELIPYGLLLSWQGRKVIYDLHEDLRADIHSKQWIPWLLRHGIGAVARGVEHFAARRFAAMVAATPYIGALFEHSAARVAVIHNYPTINELAAAPSTTAMAAAGEAATVTAETEPAAAAPATAAIRRDSVCYVGAINEMRGIRYLVHALEIAPVKLLLAGVFDPPSLRTELKAYRGWRQVEECGFVDRQKVADIMARSICGLVTLKPEPNFINALPIKLFEYMSAGLPVIASDFPLWRAIIDDAGCGICVDPENPNAIAKAINYLLTHPEQAEAMGRNGRRAAEAKYRWDREGAKLVALYGDILAATPPGGQV